ncbi:hypothetical protein AN214_01189 [Pseudoalteromonas sp. P1-9]|uniref:type IV pilin protein n=1 Tax=Pseudoalteromonas sp. P1-9 TaxID=1710354 RepID=UPI000707265B|nr:prepilin-type N-terminal cleavage/methylation domain-containing protein [Pseudoalteromonas sp. P1-9]KPV96729.1 hypothetical protein AN214_01189 [Pseudoalteromonas sp. P1-9]
MPTRCLNGFSLIELLIAVTIITMTIALTNVVYANYVQNDQRFNNRSELYADLLEITDEVRALIQQDSEKKGLINVNNTECEWLVVDSKSKQGLNFDLETGSVSGGGITYYLDQVEVSCSNLTYQLKPFSVQVLRTEIGNIGNLG